MASNNIKYNPVPEDSLDDITVENSKWMKRQTGIDVIESVSNGIRFGNI